MNNKKVSTATPSEGNVQTQKEIELNTVGAATGWASRTLSPSPTASLDSHLLLGHVLDRERAWVMAHAEDSLPDEVATRFQILVERRAIGVPVAYLRGYCEWFGLVLRVTPSVLVPRPETELLVEEAVAVARRWQLQAVVDVGTGSGAIAIALARSLPDVAITGIDRCGDALEVARYNAQSLGVRHRITWLEGNLLQPIRCEPDLIVANLPYLSTGMMDELGPDVRHEPDVALNGGSDGLDLYRALFAQRRERGWTMPVLIEIDARQLHEISRMLLQEFGERCTGVRKDYAGLDRILRVGA